MKRTLIFALPVFVLLSLVSLTATAQEINDPCQDDTTRVVQLTDLGLTVPRLQAILRDRLPEQTTCLLFSGNLQLTGNRDDFAIDIGRLFSGTPQEVYIGGLNLERQVTSENYLLTITNNTAIRVIVTDLHLSGVTNGLKLQGSGPIEVRDSQITGAGGETGACMEIQSTSATEKSVKSTEISNCSEGIRIASDGVQIGPENADRYDDDKNLIHDNGVGIHVMNGRTNNKFSLNNIYANRVAGQPITADNGISINDAVGDTGRLSVINDEESGLALRCEKDESGNVLQRKLFFSVPDGGKIDIYASNLQYKQGEWLVAECLVERDGMCTVDNSRLPDTILPTQCGMADFLVTALFTATETSKFMREPFVFDGVFTVVSAPTTLPVETSGIIDSGGDETATGTLPEFQPPDGNPVRPLLIDKDDKKTAGATGAEGKAGAAMACNVISGGGGTDIAAFLVCLTPLCVLIAMRIRKRA